MESNLFLLLNVSCSTGFIMIMWATVCFRETLCLFCSKYLYNLFQKILSHPITDELFQIVSQDEVDFLLESRHFIPSIWISGFLRKRSLFLSLNLYQKPFDFFHLKHTPLFKKYLVHNVLLSMLSSA